MTGSASVAGNNGTVTASPTHAAAGPGGNVTRNLGTGDNNRVVQRSISASSSKPRRGSTGAENNNNPAATATTTAPGTVTSIKVFL